MQLIDNRAQTDLVGVMDVVVAEDEGDVGSGIRLSGRVDADDRSGVSFINYYFFAIDYPENSSSVSHWKVFSVYFAYPRSWSQLVLFQNQGDQIGRILTILATNQRRNLVCCMYLMCSEGFCWRCLGLKNWALMKIFWHIFVLATVLATFSKNWENFSKSSGHPVQNLIYAIFSLN